MTAAHLAAVIVATVACATDLRSRRIPNLLTFTAAALGIAVGSWTGGPDGAMTSSAGWLAGLAIFFVPFALRGLGGGDVKLLAALGAWVGPTDVVWVALYTGIAGGFLALGTALANGYLRTAFANIRRLIAHWRAEGVTAMPELTLERSAAPKLAYALPILCGTVVMTWLH
jgi:prepilin peptidase CpaA